MKIVNQVTSKSRWRAGSCPSLQTGIALASKSRNCIHNMYPPGEIIHGVLQQVKGNLDEFPEWHQGPKKKSP